MENKALPLVYFIAMDKHGQVYVHIDTRLGATNSRIVKLAAASMGLSPAKFVLFLVAKYAPRYICYQPSVPADIQPPPKA